MGDCVTHQDRGLCLPTLILDSCVGLGNLLIPCLFFICTWGKWHCNSYFICPDDQMNWTQKTHAPGHSVCSGSINYHPFLAPHQHFSRQRFFIPVQDFTKLWSFSLWIPTPPLTLVRFGFSWSQICNFLRDLYFRTWECSHRWSKDISSYYYSPSYPPKEWSTKNANGMQSLLESPAYTNV